MLSRTLRLTHIWRLVLILICVLVIREIIGSYMVNRELKGRKTVRMSFTITTTWDDQSIDHKPVTVCLEPDNSNIMMTVNAPFFNDPGNPGGTTGQPFPGLWDYEVVEAFFLNDNDDYLEVELCPHGQHLLLLLHGVRNSFKDKLPLEFNATVTGNKWTGKALIPGNYFPPKVTKFNAYAIHGSGMNRTYESLYPVPTNKFSGPDFHKLEFFKPIDFRTLLPSNWSPDYRSKEWQQYYQQSAKLST